MLLLLLLPQLPLYRRSVMITPSSARWTGSYRGSAEILLTGDRCRGSDATGVVVTTEVVVTVVVAGGAELWRLWAIEVR